MKRILYGLITLLVHFLPQKECSKLIAFTFGNSHGESLSRQVESANLNNIQLRVIEHEGRIMDANRLSVFKDYIDAVKLDETVVLLVESGSLFLSSSEEIQLRFKTMGSRLVLSADSKHFPDPDLQELHPEVPVTEKRYVNANGMIGYANTIARALEEDVLKGISDFQYYFNKLFTNPDLRIKYEISLDSKSAIFQNLDGSMDEVEIQYSSQGYGFIHNEQTDTVPYIVQPNDKKLTFNTLSNYLGESWDPVNGCKHCQRSNATFTNKETSKYPFVTVAIFIDQPTPFLSEFFSRISSLTYPKQRVNILLSNMVQAHENVIKRFVEEFGLFYKSLVYIDPFEKPSMVERRKEAVKSCRESNCGYLLFVDSTVQVSKKDAIESLISYNKSLIAPMVSRRGQLWSNFWGAIGLDGYYSRSIDYLDILNGIKIGLWNVPHVNNIFLMSQELLQTMDDFYSPLKEYQKSEFDMIFSGNMRNNDRFMLVVNEDHYGHLTDAESTRSDHLNNDLWEIFSNPLDWKEKYIHENYSLIFDEQGTFPVIHEPCQDVFLWPFVSETFARQITEEMEHFDMWSKKEVDPGLRSKDDLSDIIQIKEIGWEEHWIHALKTYVYPVQVKIFKGYFDEPQSRINFVARFSPSEHNVHHSHPRSTSYTLNLALSTPSTDYKAGGILFTRYKCIVAQMKLGWVLMHPSRVTHLYETLPITAGTKYAFVTLVI